MKGKKQDLSNLTITDHAFNRFKERWLDRYPEPKNWEKLIRKLLSNVTEIKMKSWYQLLSRIKHGRNARYFESYGWVFVVDINLNKVITIYNKKNSSYRWKRLKK